MLASGACGLQTRKFPLRCDDPRYPLGCIWDRRPRPRTPAEHREILDRGADPITDELSLENLLHDPFLFTLFFGSIDGSLFIDHYAEGRYVSVRFQISNSNPDLIVLMNRYLDRHAASLGCEVNETVAPCHKQSDYGMMGLHHQGHGEFRMTITDSKQYRPFLRYILEAMVKHDIFRSKQAEAALELLDIKDAADDHGISYASLYSELLFLSKKVAAFNGSSVAERKDRYAQVAQNFEHIMSQPDSGLVLRTFVAALFAANGSVSFKREHGRCRLVAAIKWGEDCRGALKLLRDAFGFGYLGEDYEVNQWSFGTADDLENLAKLLTGEACEVTLHGRPQQIPTVDLPCCIGKLYKLLLLMDCVTECRERSSGDGNAGYTMSFEDCVKYGGMKEVDEGSRIEYRTSYQTMGERVFGARCPFHEH